MASMKAVKVAGALACLLGVVVGCNSKPADPKSEAPPPATAQQDADPGLVLVKNPEGYPLVAAAAYQAPATLKVTGTVNPDISRTIPVISIALAASSLSMRVWATTSRKVSS